MKRLAVGLIVVLLNLNSSSNSFAQEEPAPAGPSGDDTGPGPSDDFKLEDIQDIEETPTDKPDLTQKPPKDAKSREKSWEDIVVVPRKAFLKKHRLELAPFAGITLNDPLIRHYSFGGDLNFYITDILSIGLEGQYFIKELSERTSLTGLQYYRIPSLNKLKYHAALAFGYVPGYGKFGLFNKYIVHWDITFALGVGMMWTEVIPRRFGDAPFANQNIAPHVGVGARLFVLDWMTLSVTFRDYMYLDKFEAANRAPGESAEVAKASADAQSQFVQNIMMFVSLGFYVPPSFSYKTPR
jgi:outer membrane beta-barrel protein